MPNTEILYNKLDVLEDKILGYFDNIIKLDKLRLSEIIKMLKKLDKLYTINATLIEDDFKLNSLYNELMELSYLLKKEIFKHHKNMLIEVGINVTEKTSIKKIIYDKSAKIISFNSINTNIQPI